MKPITFDSSIRGLIFVVSLVALYFTFRYLSSVLIPFLVAGVLAYLLNPVCNFLQHTCRLRFRVVCVIITLLLAIALVVGLLWLCIPPMFDECTHLKDIARRYLESGAEVKVLPERLRYYLEQHFRITDTYEYLASGDFLSIVRTTVPRLWDLLYSTASIVFSIVASLIGLLYLFFLLLDYDRYAKGWTGLVPQRYRPTARKIFDDIAYYLCGYFRGQLLIALSNCVMFTVGFWIIDFPMPVALGCFIGIISFVPYLQVAGFVPAALLALLRAAETGDNFWMLMGGVVLVYIVVQIIQDVIVTPRVMGRIMGLSPAIILLALSTGAFIGGIGGLIIALPVTTLALTYYKRYVIKEPENETDN